MALISRIRKNGWILILGLGIALFSFIIQDIVQNTSRYQTADVNTVAKVNGKTIAKNAFDTYQQMVYGNSTADPFQVRTQVYNYFVEDAIVKELAEKVGLGVSKEELMDLQFGANPSPVIQQRFAGDGGQINFQQLQQIKGAIEAKTLPAEYRQYWAVQEDEIIKERLQSKVSNMVSKAIFTPKWQAEMGFAENNKRYNFNYVRIPYEKVDAAEAKLTDADYKAYLDENKEQFYQSEESRVLDVLAIDVLPSFEDSTATLKAINTTLEGWRAATSDSAYVTSVGGKIDDTYYTKAEMPAALADTMAKLPVGALVGPIIAENSYLIAKKLGTKAIPDSVRARHILIKPESVGGVEQSEKLVDSLLAVIASGKTSFDSLAAKFGSDGTASKGGDLDWFGPGAMVKPFNDMAFFKLEQGKPSKVLTNFGWHVIEVTGKKFTTNQSGTKMALISERIRPSKNTMNKFRDIAESLATSSKTADQLKDAATKQGLQIQPAPPVRENDFQIGTIANGQDARDILRWAFDDKTKTGGVSNQVFTIADQTGGYFDSKYIVAALKEVRPKGYATVDAVKQQIETQVMNRKKAEILKSKIQNAGSLEAVAGQYGVTVDAASGVNFFSPALGQTAPEPKVVGRALGLKAGEISQPIGGNQGVYLVSSATPTADVQTPPDLTMFRKQLASGMSSQVRARLISTMKKEAKIDDFRSKFF